MLLGDGWKVLKSVGLGFFLGGSIGGERGRQFQLGLLTAILECMLGFTHLEGLPRESVFISSVLWCGNGNNHPANSSRNNHQTSQTLAKGRQPLVETQNDCNPVTLTSGGKGKTASNDSSGN